MREDPSVRVERANHHEKVIIPPPLAVNPVPLDMLVVAKLENLNVFLFIAWPSPL